jgi:autoinducer 2-degrading protein
MTMASRFAITVDFEILEGGLDRFLALVRDNAARSVADEPGCFRFDVLVPGSGAEPRVFLYEIYADRSAFDHHLGTPHFLQFDAASRDLVRRKTVAQFSVTENSKA